MAASGKGQCGRLCGRLYEWMGRILAAPPVIRCLWVKRLTTGHVHGRVFGRSSSGSAHLEAAQAAQATHGNPAATPAANSGPQDSGKARMGKASLLLANSFVCSAPVANVNNGYVAPSQLSGPATSSMRQRVHTVTPDFGAPGAADP